jgi:hypothetical protein
MSQITQTVSLSPEEQELIMDAIECWCFRWEGVESLDHDGLRMTYAMFEPAWNVVSRLGLEFRGGNYPAFERYQSIFMEPVL